MPIMRIDLLKGRTDKELQSILDVSYQAARKTLGIPEGDRYQIITQHESNEMVLLDTGMGFQRTSDRILFMMQSRPRTQEQKISFYHELTEGLQSIGIMPKDVMVSFVINDDEDWSFAFGEAQFLNGSL